MAPKSKSQEELRLRVLQETKLLDSDPERSFDRLTRLAAGLLHAPVALVSLVDDHRQYFKSAFGLGEPWASLRETPLTHSFCQYAVKTQDALVVSDARVHPTLKTNLAIRDLNVIAYAGIPLMVDNEAIGAFCVADGRPREWSEDELRLLNDLAESVISEIELRIALRGAQKQRALTEALLDSVGDPVLAVGTDRRFLIANAAARRVFGEGAEAGRRLPLDWTDFHRSQRADGTAHSAEEGALTRGLRGEDTNGLEFSVDRGERGATWLEAKGRAVRGENEEVIAAVAVYRDVTEKKRRTDLYTTLVGQIPRAAVALFDRDYRCIAIDGGLMRDAGRESAQYVGRKAYELTGVDADAPQRKLLEDAQRRTLDGEAVTFDLARDDRTLSIHTSPVRDALGRISTGIMLAMDVSAERRTQAALTRSEQVYRAIVQNLPNGGVLMVDRELRYVTADGPIIESTLRNARLSTMVGKRVAEVASEANRDTLLDVYRAVLAGETRNIEVERNGQYYDMRAVPVFAGSEISHALVFLYDVTTRKLELTELEEARATLEKHAQDLREASVTDELTGLLNRRGFSLIADQGMKAAIRNNQRLILFFVDLNGMKTINDTLGHEMGDRALMETAALLRQVFRGSDVIARLGGDEFVVLAIDAAPGSEALIASRLDAAVREQGGPKAPFTLSLSIGSSIFDPAQPVALDKLLSEADARMYEKKRSLRARSG